MKKEEKTQSVSDIVAMLEKASSLYFTDFSGMTVEQANALRREFHSIGVQYKVVKNTLARRAFQQVGGYDDVQSYLIGPTGIVFGADDPIAPARLIKKFIDGNQKPSVRICVVEKKIFDGSRLPEVAALPTRNDLIAGIVGSIQSPIAGIAGVLGALARDLVYALDAIEKKKAESPSAS